MKNIILFGIFLFICEYGWGQGAALERLLQTSGMENAAVSISVKRVEDGETVLQYNPHMSLSPASLVKIFTTALVLNEKEKDFRYETHVYYTGKIKDEVLEGNILVKPSGDPTLDSQHFPEVGFINTVVKRIRELGIHKIKGDIIVTDPKTRPLPGKWLWEDVSNYYGSQYHNFNYRDNTYIIKLASGKAERNTKILSVSPPQPGIEFVNNIKASKDKSDNAWIYGGPYSKEMHLLGVIPPNRSSYFLRGAMHNPAKSFVRELADSLNKYGITWDSTGVKSSSETLIYKHNSPSLEEIVAQANKLSINLLAEALGNLISEKNFQYAANKRLDLIGIDTLGITLKDASGLSPMNAVPSEVFTDLLIWSYRNLGDAFINSLAVAGTDKMLNRYYNDVPLLKNNLRAKTGSLSGVRGLAGYVQNVQGDLLAFTIIFNNYTCPVPRLNNAINEFLVALTE